MKYKTDLVRFLIIGISLLSIQLLISCNKDSETLVNVRVMYVNNSSYDMEISSTRKGDVSHLDIVDMIFLPIRDTAVIFQTTLETGKLNNDVSQFDNFIEQNDLYDSISIVFDNEKYVVYEFCLSSSNQEIFSLQNYEAIEASENNFDFYFLFSNEDYSRAE